MVPWRLGQAIVELTSIEGLVVEAILVGTMIGVVAIDHGVGVLTARSVSSIFGV